MTQYATLGSFTITLIRATIYRQMTGVADNSSPIELTQEALLLTFPRHENYLSLVRQRSHLNYELWLPLPGPQLLSLPGKRWDLLV
jgi:hypothetical protein